ncbi:hypothetical protein [Flavobacterium sp. ENC]|uniref:hypothetical protein n=1 Tax=Flavobacterium sp. ENC TaxID=2897330 RepID=UPI001E60F26F|nr:hypothetical protein [Flavobacterium sp. ENC]MCD0467018.1 hypothetical protein [Flavobacterium sp. ENC]
MAQHIMTVYDSLYLDILKIGRANVESGLSFIRLREKLEQEGYDFSNYYIEVAVKTWFYDTFHHALSDHGPIEYHELDSHLECNFVMKGDACLKLISYNNSSFNNKLTLYSVILAGIALIASIIAIIVSLYYY